MSSNSNPSKLKRLWKYILAFVIINLCIDNVILCYMWVTDRQIIFSSDSSLATVAEGVIFYAGAISVFIGLIYLTSSFFRLLARVFGAKPGR